MNDHPFKINKKISFLFKFRNLLSIIASGLLSVGVIDYVKTHQSNSEVFIVASTMLLLALIIFSVVHDNICNAYDIHYNEILDEKSDQILELRQQVIHLNDSIYNLSTRTTTASIEEDEEEDEEYDEEYEEELDEDSYTHLLAKLIKDLDKRYITVKYADSHYKKNTALSKIHNIMEEDKQ
jgi:hypothetical protein